MSEPASPRRRGVCDRPYTTPAGVRHLVDAALEDRVLDRLNRLENLHCYAVCVGHADGRHATPQAYVLFSVQAFDHLKRYLLRLSSTRYRAVVEYYSGRWRIEVRREEEGQAPPEWWYGLVDELEESPDCARWMSR